MKKKLLVMLLLTSIAQADKVEVANWTSETVKVGVYSALPGEKIGKTLRPRTIIKQSTTIAPGQKATINYSILGPGRSALLAATSEEGTLPKVSYFFKPTSNATELKHKNNRANISGGGYGSINITAGSL